MGAGLLGAPLLGRASREGRVPQDAWLALLVVASQALTLLGARFLGTEYQHVQSALYGDSVVASTQELWLLGGVAALVLGLHAIARDRFLLVAFDSESARAQGMPTRRWGLLLGVTVGTAIAATARGLGVLPAFAFSVAPAAAGLLAGASLRSAMTIGVLLAVAAATLGYYLSFVHDLPTGPTMVGVLGLGVLGAALVGRGWRHGFGVANRPSST